MRSATNRFKMKTNNIFLLGAPFFFIVAANAQSFPELDDAFRVKQLEPPTGKVRMVLDTDAYNEIDDQYALIYACLSKEKLQLEAIYAAPFRRSRHKTKGQGMEESYQEIIRLLEFLGKSPEGFAFRGSYGFLEDISKPIQSEAVTDLINRALASSPDDPLYVVPIGPITNIASAILIEPKIMENIVVVWLGGNGFYWESGRAGWHNVGQNRLAAQVVLNSGVPLVYISCYPVTRNLSTTIPEVKENLRGKNELSDYLVDIFIDYTGGRESFSKPLWDLGPIAWLINPSWVRTSIVRCPILTDQITFRFDDSRHLVRHADSLNRDAIFNDLFTKIANLPPSSDGTLGLVNASGTRAQANSLDAIRFVAGSSFLADTLHARFTSTSTSGVLRMAIYADNDGAPGAVLGDTAEFDIGPGLRSAALRTPVDIKEGSVYWISAWVQRGSATNVTFVANDGAGTRFRAEPAYSATASFPGGSTLSHSANVTYAVFATGTED